MKRLWLVLMSFFLPISTGSEDVTMSQKNLEHQELFAAYYEQAEKRLQNMSKEEKVGQLFLARMDQNTIFSEISSFYPGGYVLFARDFEGEDLTSISTKIKSYQEQSAIPLVLAVDEEGGSVTRVSRYQNFRENRFASNQELYQRGGFSLVEEIEREKVSLLKEIGLNLNLAPVADVSNDPKDYIYKRSFGQDAPTTSEYIKRIVKLDRELQFADCLKHFPGYGNNVDTHTGIAIDERDYGTFIQNDYLPFQAGIHEKVPTILVSHNIVKSVDDQQPASLSFKVHQELREKLRFTGLILTDDLAMDAISKYTHGDSSAVLAVLAGNDLIITSNLSDDYKAVLEAYDSGKIKQATLDTAVRRILAFKYAYRIA